MVTGGRDRYQAAMPLAEDLNASMRHSMQVAAVLGQKTGEGHIRELLKHHVWVERNSLHTYTMDRPTDL